MSSGAEDAAGLRQRLEAEGEQALAALFAQHRERLLRLVEFRLDVRLRGRVEAEDVLQEAYMDAAKRMHHFAEDTSASFFIWLRMIVTQTMIDIHRRHLGTQARDARRETGLRGGGRFSQTTSFSLAASLLHRFPSPTHAARKAETAERLRAVLEEMDPIDREVLALRHFEELTNSEVAEELGIEQKTASIRYVRALRRLKDLLAAMPGFVTDAGGA